MRSRLGSLGIAFCLLFAIAPAARAANGASHAAVSVDNTAANHIATGVVLKADPAQALLEVKNNFHFWVAVEVQSATKAVLKPADWTEDFGGVFAAGGLINPGGTASWDAVFDTSSGGLATVHVHYDPLTSAGGAAALAANILTIIADSLGVSLSTADPGLLVTGFKSLMDLPQFADFIREAQQQDIWGLATSIEIMLKSQTGRAAILEALREFGVHVTEGQLIGLSSLVSLYHWVQTITDLLWASFWGETDGSVTFWLAGTSVAAPTPTSTPRPTPSPTPEPAPVGPPPAPTGVAYSQEFVDDPQQIIGGHDTVSWNAASEPPGTTITVAGTLRCLAPAGSPEGTSCLALHTSLAASDLVILGVVPAGVGHVTWDSAFGIGPGCFGMTTTLTQQIFALVVWANNDAGQSRAIIVGTPATVVGWGATC